MLYGLFSQPANIIVWNEDYESILLEIQTITFQKDYCWYIF